MMAALQSPNVVYLYDLQISIFQHFSEDSIKSGNKNSEIKRVIEF